MSLILRFETPPEHYIKDLAPRVEGKGQFVGEYGYALSLTHNRVRVVWDDGGFDDVMEHELLFIEPIYTRRKAE